MKILVISSCTKCKRDYRTSAAQMYTGEQHKHLMKGLEQVREKYGKQSIDLAIISAKYGLLLEGDIIDPYNYTFAVFSPAEIKTRSDHVELHDRTKELITQYDLVFFLLGEKYVQALQLASAGFVGTDAVTQIFLAGKSYRDRIPDNAHFIDAGKDLERQLGISRRVIKGPVFKRLCGVACREGLEVFEKIRQDPRQILDLVVSPSRCR